MKAPRIHQFDGSNQVSIHVRAEPLFAPHSEHSGRGMCLETHTDTLTLKKTMGENNKIVLDD